jgi:hypothetical protein
MIRVRLHESIDLREQLERSHRGSIEQSDVACRKGLFGERVPLIGEQAERQRRSLHGVRSVEG